MARRAAPLLLLALLALIAASYVDAAPAVYVVAAIVAAFAVGLISPALGVAATLGLAPAADGLAALVQYGTASAHEQVGIGWIEPVFVGVAGGMVTRIAWRGGGSVEPLPAARFYVVAMVGALVAVVSGYTAVWRGDAGYLMVLMWRALPYQLVSEPTHALRAGLVLLAAPLWLWLVRTSVGGPGEARAVSLAWLGGALVTAMFGTWMWLRGEGLPPPRTRSVLEGVNSYGSYLVLTLFVALAVIASGRRRRPTIFAVVVLGATAWMLLLTGSKIALAAAVTAVTGVALASLRGRWLRVALAAIVAALAVLVLWHAVEVRYPRGVPSILSEFTTSPDLVGYFVEYRLPIWSASARAVVENPAFGIGPGMLFRDIGNYYGDESGWRPENENAHNYFLQLAAETGLLGLAGFAWVLWACLRPALTDRGPHAAPRRLLAVGALGYLATLLTGHPLLLSRQVVLFWGVVGLASVPFATGAPAPPRRRVVALYPWAVLAVLVLTLLWRPVTLTCSRPPDSRTPVTWKFVMGFHGPERSPEWTWRWMKDAGQLMLCNHTGRPLVADLTFTTAAFAEPRRLAVYANGRPVARLALTPILNASPAFTTLSLPGLALPPGRRDLVFVPSPGPRRADAVLRNADPRRLSVVLGDPVIAIRPSP
ncbi:MAG: O-antigen ligase family protein [Candidatus Rokubacteria bacterium]|nr:O-antigen ligase family protein [Candidatus Rokubacteria bacterium]